MASSARLVVYERLEQSQDLPASNLTFKPLNHAYFWVGDRIRAKLFELRFRCHMPATRP